MEVPSCERCEVGSVSVPIAKWPASAPIDGEVDADAVAFAAVEAFNTALARADYDAIGSLFTPDGYWRDHLVSSWDLRTLKGKANIVYFLKTRSRLQKLEIDRTSAWTAPKVVSFDCEGGAMGVEVFLTFVAEHGAGRGIMRLVPEPGNRWKTWTFYVALEKLHGFEEPLGPRRSDGVRHGAEPDRKNWLDRRKDELNFEHSDPDVLIIGGGQSGLTAHARLKMLNVSALIIDTNETVGDNWRQRYHQLVLHDPVWYDHMPYLPFPSWWPVFAPKDKIADFLESYAKLLELNVWMRTTLESSKWEESTKSWEVTVRRNVDGKDEVRTLKPKHIMLATGLAGVKRMPAIKGIDAFQGSLLCHASDFPGAKSEAKRADGTARKAVVVGACNSSHDICQDYYEKGYDVTMVQRSTTYVVSSPTIIEIVLGGAYSETSLPVEDADIRSWGTPSEIQKAQHINLNKVQLQRDTALLRGLEKAGFALDHGPGGSGLFMKAMQRGGGYYIDVGASQLIIDGKIKIKQGQAITEVLPHGLQFADGSELEADEIVFATGYENIRSQARAILGDAVADRIDYVWGFDKEGEMKTVWRPSGHPGFWVHAGNLAMCRYFSRTLALQIKAQLEGIA